MMNREDLLSLIVEHGENQGLLEDSWFAMVQTMTTDELEAYLDQLEAIAVYGYCDMPNPSPLRKSNI